MVWAPQDHLDANAELDDLGAPRGALLYSPHSGHGLEEVSLDLMAPQARYVRAFNTLGWENFAEPLPGTALFFAADPSARPAAEELITAVGLEPVFVGDAAASGSMPCCPCGSRWSNRAAGTAGSRCASSGSARCGYWAIQPDEHSSRRRSDRARQQERAGSSRAVRGSGGDRERRGPGSRRIGSAARLPRDAALARGGRPRRRVPRPPALRPRRRRWRPALSRPLRSPWPRRPR
jgi:hypothetical protein